MRTKQILSATSFIILVNIMVFVVEFLIMSTNDVIGETCAMYTPAVLDGQIWRIFTSMFLHANITHILMNMVSLNNVGYFLESYLGTVKYTLLYLIGGICGNIAVMLVDIVTNTYMFCVGASGAIFAVLGAILAVAIKDRNAGLNPAGIASSVVFALIPGFVVPGISWSAHLGGLIGGFVLALFLGKKR